MSPFKKIQSNLNTYYTKLKNTPTRIAPITPKNGLSSVQLPFHIFDNVYIIIEAISIPIFSTHKVQTTLTPPVIGSLYLGSNFLKKGFCCKTCKPQKTICEIQEHIYQN